MNVSNFSLPTKTALVIGGTGPTGHFIVNGLIKRGFHVAILHSGNHEVDEIPPEVEHIHTNAYDESCLRTELANRTFDVCIAAYGRLRVIADIMRGQCGQFISIGGQPCYVGYMNPMCLQPEGLPVPTAETATLISAAEQDEKGYRIVRTEKTLFELQPDATHFRYPVVYGAYQALPREWSIVKRILDGRPHMILPDGGLSLVAMGYAENLAHAILLAVDQPDKAAGEIFNCADTQTLTLKQMVDILATGLGHEWRVVDMPYDLAIPARPLLMQPRTTHRVMDTSKLRYLLGYKDVVAPEVALLKTAEWLIAHPPAMDSWEVIALEDPFDYAAEDELIMHWDKLLSNMPVINFTVEPGYGMAYSGPGGRPRSNKTFSE